MNTNTAEQTRTEHEKLLDWLASGSVTHGLGCAGLIMAAAAEHNALLAQRDALAAALGEAATVLRSYRGTAVGAHEMAIEKAEKILASLKQ